MKLCRMCGILYRVRNYLTQEAFISMYYTLCYPHLIYCVSLWACTWPSFLKNFQIAQNKLFRCIFHMNKLESTHHVISVHKLINFNNIYKYFFLLFICKCLTHFNGNQSFRLVSSSQNTRSNNLNLLCPYFRTVLFKNSLLRSEPHVWNSLPTEIKHLLQSGNVN